MDIHFNAFISYRHHPEDIKVAEQIHKGLERYKIPKAIKKKTGGKMRLFRDKEELPISSNLTDDITKALRNSDFLIVICSTHVKESLWVQREIETFLQTHDHSRVLTVLVDGEDPYDIIPEILCSKEGIDPVTGEKKMLPIEPLSCDWRVGKRKAYREELPRLAAALLGCGYDELRQRERQYRTRRLITALSVIMALLIGFVGYVLHNSMLIQQANDQLEAANNQLTDANIEIQKNLEEAQINQSQYLASASEQSMEAGDRMLAITLALEALPKQEGARPYVAQAEKALSDAVGAYKAESEIQSTGVLTSDGLVNYFDATDNRDWMYVFDQRYVLSVWNLETYQKRTALALGDSISKMLVTPQDNVLLRRSDSVLLCYDKDLNLVWQAENCQDMATSAERDVVILLTTDNVMRFLDSATGEQVREDIGLYLRPEDEKAGCYAKLRQKTYDLTRPMALEYYCGYDIPSHILSLDPVSGSLRDLGALGEGREVRYTGLTESGDLLVLTVDDDAWNNGDFGTMMTHSAVDVRLLCYRPEGGLRWTANMTSYSYSTTHTLYPIPGQNTVFCQIDNLLALVDTDTGEVLGTCETGATPVWVRADEDVATAMLEDGSMGTYYYEDNEFNSSYYFKEDITQGFAGKGAYIRQSYTREILAYWNIRDKNWQIFSGDYDPTISHRTAWENLVAIDNYDGICLFDAQQKKLMWTLLEESDENFCLLGFSDDGSALWVANDEGEILCIDSQTGEKCYYYQPNVIEENVKLHYYNTYSTNSCGMVDGVIYSKAKNLRTDEIYLVTFDTATKKSEVMEVCSVEAGASSLTGQILTVSRGMVYLWEESAAKVYKVDPVAKTVEVFLENAQTRPVVQFLDNTGTYMLCMENEVKLYKPDGKEVFCAQLEDQKGVSSYLTPDQLLLLTDAGNITRFDLSGQKLGEIGCNIYTSFASNFSLYGAWEILWSQTADGDLFLNIYNAGNLIDCDTWQLRAWMPDCVAYLQDLNQVVTVGKDSESYEMKMGSFPLYSLEELKDMAQKALNGYTLTQEQKDQYGIS